MKILQMIDSLKVGGAEKMQVTLAKAAQKSGLDLSTAYLRSCNGSPIPGQLQALGAQVHPFIAKKILDPGRLWQLVCFARQERFDVIHTHLLSANVVGALVGRLTGTPVIASLRTAGYDLRYHSAARWQLETWVLRYGAQRIMAVGYVVADVNRERLPGKHITVVPNAVFPPPDMPPDEQLALRTELAGDSSRPILISVGRLELPKGFSDLLVAMAILRETHPRAILLIAGDGKLRAELTAQITELKLDRHVKLLGIRNDVPRLLAASDIYVNSSHWEGLPVSVLEAMAAGLPVVATNVGDTPRVVVDGTGMIVPPKQPELVASTLRSLLDDPGQMHAIGEKARLHIASHHSPEAWFNQLLTLYKDAMKH